MRVVVRILIGVVAALPVVGGLVLLSLWSGSDEPRRFDPVVIEPRSVSDGAGPGSGTADEPQGRKERQPRSELPPASDGEPNGPPPDDPEDDVTVVGPAPTRVDDEDDAGDDGGDDDRDGGERNDTDD